MRVLLDTNVVVSALLFPGVPRHLLRALCSPPFELWTSRPLLRELAVTLASRKLTAAVAGTGQTIQDLLQAYAGHAFVVPDDVLVPVEFEPDPSDAAVIAAARGAGAEWLVTGDRHLLNAQEAMPCRVLTVADALARTEKLIEERPV